MTMSNASATFRCTEASADSSVWGMAAAAGRIRRTCNESGVDLWSVSGAILATDSVVCTKPSIEGSRGGGDPLAEGLGGGPRQRASKGKVTTDRFR